MIGIPGGSSTQISSLVLLALAVWGGIKALTLRDQKTFQTTLAVFFTVFLGALATGSRGEVGYILLFLSIPSAWIAAKIALSHDDSETQELPRSMRVALLFLLCSAGIGLTFYRLGTYTTMALTWESPVIEDLVAELESGRHIVESFVNRLRWNHGVLSGGADSMVFGFPALLALKYLVANLWALRLPAAIAFVGASFAIFMVAQRTFGVVASISALALLGLNQVVLIYARYGSSAAGSLCALLFGLLTCVRLIQTQRIVFAPLAVLWLYLATLGYAPARVPVLVLVAMTPIGIVLSRKFQARRKVGALAAFMLALVPIVSFQILSHSTHFYLAARGEQFFGMLVTNYWPDEILALQTISRTTKPLTPGEMIGVAVELIRQVTWPQLVSLLDPISPELRRASDVTLPPFHDDPLYLKLVAPAVTPFFMLGICACVRARQYWLFSVLFAWILSAFGSVLLSNRVDDHRVLFLTIPFSLFAACGVSAFARAWKMVRCAHLPIVVAAATLLCTGVLPRTHDMFDASGSNNSSVTALREVIADLPPSNIVLVTDIFHRDLAVLRLDLWRDKETSGKQTASLQPELRDALVRGTAQPRPAVAQQLTDLVKQGATIILHPAARYLPTASLMAKQGVAVYSRAQEPHQFLVIDRRRDLPPTSFQLASLPLLADSPRVPAVLPSATGVPLSSLVPINQNFGFSEMRLNLTWGGTSILIDGEQHESGLGLHAPTVLRYAVPTGATAFQTIIAIDDDAQSCSRGSARITIRDQKGTVLYQSGVVTHGAPKVALVGIQGVKELELEVDDAGDGRDCDHVDLAGALFVVPPGNAAGCVCPAVECPFQGL